MFPQQGQPKPRASRATTQGITIKGAVGLFITNRYQNIFTLRKMCIVVYSSGVGYVNILILVKLVVVSVRQKVEVERVLYIMNLLDSFFQ